MARLIIHRTTEMVAVDLDCIIDNTISLEARGMYALICSFNGKKCTKNKIIEYSLKSEEEVSKIIEELVEHGYLTPSSNFEETEEE